MLRRSVLQAVAALLWTAARCVHGGSSLESVVAGDLRRQARKVAESTLTTDCADVDFPDRNTTNTPELCIWTPSGLCYAATYAYYNKTYRAPNSASPKASFDGVYANITADYLESLPQETLISLTNVGIKRINPSLSVDPYGADPDMPLQVTNLSLSYNKITSIVNITFPSSLKDLSFNSIGNNAVQLSKVSDLATLKLTQNNVTTLANVSFPPALSYLNVSSNGLTSVAPLPSSIFYLYVAPAMTKPNSSRDLSKNKLTKLTNITWPSNLTKLYLDGNNIDEIYLRFSPAIRHICLGNNPLKRLRATRKMLDNLNAHAQFNNVSVCGPQAWNYSELACTTRICATFGSYAITIENDAVADSALYSHGDGDSNGTTSLHVSIFILCFSAVIISVSVFLELKRRCQRQEYGSFSDNTPRHRSIDDSIELHNDIRFDPLYKALFIPPERVTRERLLARGGYGVVYLAMWTSDKGLVVPVALKRMLPDRVENTAYIEYFMDEIRLCSSLNHVNIVTFHGYTWTTLASLSMLSEYMSQGDVWTLLDSDRIRRQLSWNISTDFVMQFDDKPAAFPTDPGLIDADCPFSKETIVHDVVSALVYLQSMDIIHRDLKAKNVMLSADSVAKLTDFGTSRSCGSDDETMTAEIGTVAWIAPEVLKGVRYSTKADMYSFGVLLSELDTMEVPYSKMHLRQLPNGGQEVNIAKTRLAMLVVAGELRPGLSPMCPPCIKALAERCLAYNPDDRPTAAQVLAWLEQLRLRRRRDEV
ncbi:hypothetical protein LEN26_011217 [Aphanomyces euteiches]|nr:hypothetical protein LEN26_011217 [Aphanomyces euteiches]